MEKAEQKTEVWEIVLLTPQGLKTEYWTPNEKSLSIFEDEMVDKYKTFITSSSKLKN